MMSGVMKRNSGWLLLVMIAALAWPGEALAQKTVLRLRVDGPMMEGPSESAGLMAILADEKVQTLRGWVTMVRDAAADSDVDGLALIIEEPQINLAQMEEMINAVQDFKKSGKPVYCYLDFGSNATYPLAAAADHITIAEYSELAIIGLHAELMYFKGLLDKLGMEMEMVHAGAYKSALEPFTRTEPSEAAAENIDWLLDGIYDRWIELMAEGRGVSVEQMLEYVNQAPLSAAQAKELGLVDEVGSFSDFAQLIRKEFGKDAKIIKKYEQNAFEKPDLSNPFAVFQLFASLMEGVQESKAPGVGLIHISGPIIVGTSDDGPFGGGQTAGSTTIRSALEKARKDDKIKAVVLRVDSPGGSALASDIMWVAATKLAQEKPLIVSMGSVAGSGGYYVSIPGDTIFADESTLTGSIGVIGGKLIWTGLLEGKLGITTTSFSRGAHSGLMSPSRPWTESEREWIETFIAETYAQFKGRVMESRGDRIQGNLEDMAGGRVFTGQQALELGLIDKIGGLSDALAMARANGGLEKDCEVYILPKPSEIAQLFELLEALSGKSDEDEFEVALRNRIQSDVLLGTALPIVRQLAPDQFAEMARCLQNLVILQRERAGCFMPAFPRLR